MSGRYNSGRQAFARGDIKWKPGGDIIRAVLVTDGYTPNYTTDANLTDIPQAYRKGDTILTLLEPTDGACDASNIVFNSVPANLNIKTLVLYKQGSSDSNSTLLVAIDEAMGLPIITNGSDILVNWQDGSNKIFRI